MTFINQPTQVLSWRTLVGFYLCILMQITRFGCILGVEIRRVSQKTYLSIIHCDFNPSISYFLVTGQGSSRLRSPLFVKTTQQNFILLLSLCIPTPPSES